MILKAHLSMHSPPLYCCGLCTGQVFLQTREEGEVGQRKGCTSFVFNASVYTTFKISLRNTSIGYEMQSKLNNIRLG